jgi:hypothetical protein
VSEANSHFKEFIGKIFQDQQNRKIVQEQNFKQLL